MILVNFVIKELVFCYIIFILKSTFYLKIIVV